eukprot:TRINITY_DN1099_c1_g1_i1.p1 TRINITY_DN1099_c1_g1~~TRINITY_DN1099_c1_g1_i1.p1  ORF type:complete len:480 (+),score=101.48 TRINITY_DN1099_c1_g1_i1:90-1442(+)
MQSSRQPLLMVFAAMSVMVPEVQGGRLNKLGQLRCSACKVIAGEIMERKRSLLEKEKQPVQVSHRLGNGKWDPHGDGGVKKLSYANSELLSIEATEGICTGISGYKLRNTEEGHRVFSKNPSFSEAVSYNKQDADCVKKPNKVIEETCNEFLDDYDEEIHEMIRKPFTDEEFAENFCRIVETCRSPEFDLKQEDRNKAAFEDRRSRKWERTRLEGTAKSYQIADFHFAHEGVEMSSYDGVEATSESQDHPGTEGPANLMDKNPKTKCLDNGKKSFLFNFTVDAVIDSFTFTTANDFPERDPVKWHLQVSVQTPQNEEGENTTVTWETLHNMSTPYPTPTNRSVMLEWFSFPSLNVTNKVIKFTPVFGGVKKPKKKVKKEDDTAPKKPKLGDLKPGKDPNLPADMPHFKMPTHDEDGNPLPIYEHVEKLADALKGKTGKGSKKKEKSEEEL